MLLFWSSKGCLPRQTLSPKTHRKSMKTKHESYNKLVSQKDTLVLVPTHDNNNNNNNNNNGHFYGARSLARSRAQCAVQKAAEKCINSYNGQNFKKTINKTNIANTQTSQHANFQGRKSVCFCFNSETPVMKHQ